MQHSDNNFLIIIFAVLLYYVSPYLNIPSGFFLNYETIINAISTEPRAINLTLLSNFLITSKVR